MTPIQLLEETEKAVGDPELSRQHTTLITKSADLKKMDTTMAARNTVLKNLKDNNAELEKDVQRIQERKKLLDKAENLKKKLPWLKYDQNKARFQASKAKEKETKRLLNEAVAKSEDLKKPVEASRKKKSEIEAAARKWQQVHERFESQRQSLIENESNMGEQVRAKAREILEVNKRESNRQEKIAASMRDLAAAEEELANLPAYEPPTAELRRIADEIRELELGMGERRNQRTEKQFLFNQKQQQRDQVVRRIAEINSVKNRLLQALKDSGARGVTEAYNWVESHRSEFCGEVHGPVLLEINIADKEHAKYVENHVPKYIWKSFITQDERDRNLLVKSLSQFEVPIINAREQVARNPPRITPQMREIGIVADRKSVV